MATSPLEDAEASVRDLCLALASVAGNAQLSTMEAREGHTDGAAMARTLGAVQAALVAQVPTGVTASAADVLAKLKAYFDTLYQAQGQGK
jgi:hypothetical protein